MAWSDPGDFVSGQILTAAQMDAIREATFFGRPTFTNEAARTAAIPATAIALQEGLQAYLTASTVTTATGATTAIPTGIQTIYNGTAWVTTTPVGAYSNTSGTTASTTFVTTLTGDGTAISATLSTGTTALVMSTAQVNSSVAASVGLAVSVSGATTIAASDTVGTLATVSTTNYWVTPVRTWLLGGLTAGTNTFTLNYKTSAGTSTWAHRGLTVVGVA